MIRNTTRNQKLGWVLFIAYLTLLVYFMFFAESFGRNPDLREYSYNLGTVQTYVTERST